MTKNQKILGAIGLGVVAYLAYKNYKKGWTMFGKDAEDTKVDAESTSNITGEYAESLKNLPEYAFSNAAGTMCKCDNGFTGRCESGDCSKCCGTYNKRKPEQRRYKF
jgi:hypothetical protein